MLTWKNWRRNRPQRIIAFHEDQPDMGHYRLACEFNCPTYGIPLISFSDDNRELGFGIVNDTLNDAQLVPISDTLSVASALQRYSNNVVLGRIVSTYLTQSTISFIEKVTNDEFVVAIKK
jgi:hypothetical protein